LNLRNGVWLARRLVPGWLSGQLLHGWARIALPSVKPTVPVIGKTITLAGLLSTPSGIGETARLLAEGLADIGCDVGLIDVADMLRLPGGAQAPAPRANLRYKDVGGPLLVVLNPPDFQKALLLGRLAARRRQVIAYWYWELAIVPPSWRKAFRLVHEIWAPTRFVGDSMLSSGWSGPMRRIPPPLRMPTRASSNGIRQHTALRALCVFAYDSGFNRKNPLAAISAFRQAFGDRDDVELVLKVRGSSTTGRPERQFAEAIAGYRNIRAIDATLSREAYLDLLEASDVMLSMHRAEGLGLPLAEAMLVGKPVIATAWSGNLDFMNEDSACLVSAKMVPAVDESKVFTGLGAEWADPSISQAADWLVRLLDPALRAEIGERGQRYAVERLGLAGFSRAYWSTDCHDGMPVLTD
jgi:glycosyltransferase involved in cell wall biosynthesis